jgi:hypothetical protein
MALLPERDILLDAADLALMRTTLRVVHDNYGVLDEVALECKPEELRGLQEKLAEGKTTKDGMIVRLSEADMHALGRVAFFAADTYEWLPFNGQPTMQELEDLDLRWTATQDRHFPEHARAGKSLFKRD